MSATSKPKGRRTSRWIILAAAALFFGVVVADSLGVFRTKPYVAVPHGDHVHYVPEDRDPDVPINQFPRQEPGADERITATGRVVQK